MWGRGVHRNSTGVGYHKLSSLYSFLHFLLILCMKLLLCSYAPHKAEKLEKAFLDLLTKPIKENKLFILSTDTTSQFHQEQLELVKQGYLRLGIFEKNITIYNLITDTIPIFDDLDVLHV